MTTYLFKDWSTLILATQVIWYLQKCMQRVRKKCYVRIWKVGDNVPISELEDISIWIQTVSPFPGGLSTLSFPNHCLSTCHLWGVGVWWLALQNPACHLCSDGSLKLLPCQGSTVLYPALQPSCWVLKGRMWEKHCPTLWNLSSQEAEKAGTISGVTPLCRTITWLCWRPRRIQCLS